MQIFCLLFHKMNMQIVLTYLCIGVLFEYLYCLDHDAGN